MEWKWHKVMREELAQFVTADAYNLVTLPVDRAEVLKEPDGRRRLAREIYQTLAMIGVRYAPEKYHPEKAIQKVRTPNEVLVQPREGTCLDLAAVFCGVCEGGELLPILILLKDHALAAVSLNYGLRDWDAPGRSEEDLFERGALRDWKEIAKLVEDGSYLAVECTGFTRVPQTQGPKAEAQPRMTFEEASGTGLERVKDAQQFEFALDIGVARFRWLIESMAADVQRAVRDGLTIEEEPVLEFLRKLGSAGASDYFLKVAGEKLGASEAATRLAGPEPLPEHLDRQVVNLMAARRKLAEEGVKATPETDYRLGILAAFRRDYDTAEGCLRRVVEARPRSAKAVESFMWLQQSRAVHDLNRGDPDAALVKLKEARLTGRRSKLDTESVRNLQGFVEKTTAQALGHLGNERAMRLHLNNAGGLFEAAIRGFRKSPEAWNGLANVRHLQGDYPEAEKFYKTAIRLNPSYAAPHHDLALLFEQRAKVEPAQSQKMLRKALESWKQTCLLGEKDPGFSAEDLGRIRHRIADFSQMTGGIKGGGKPGGGGGFGGAGGFGGLGT